MSASDCFARIFYHFHNKYFNLMLGACKDAISKFASEPSFKLYHSLALILTNRLEEGVHDLEGMTHENDIKLASTIALMYGHKFLGVASRELFVKLDIQMKEYRKSADAHDFYNSAFVLVTLNKSEKALDYSEKAISMRSDSDFSSLKGWILLTLKTLGKHNATNIKSIFSKALHDNPKDLLAILGLTECCLYLGEFGEALSIINQAVVKFTTTNLPLLQKVKVHFAAQDWDQTLEAVNRFSSAEAEMLYGAKYELLISLCHSQDNKATCSGIRKVAELAKKFEPNNTAVVLEASRLFSKLSAKRENILNETISMLEGIMQTNIDSAELVVELGNQHLLLGKTKDAVRLFKSATKIDEGYFEAFLGLSVCEYLENGQSQQLFKQIQYLLELKDASNSLPLHLLQAKASESSTDALNHLKVIFDIKTHLLKANYYSDKYLINLDPDFTIDVIKEYLQHTTSNKQVLEHALELADVVAKACPSLSEALYLQSKLQHLKGDSLSALRTLETMANMSEIASSEAGLLMAQIQVNNGQFDRAHASLEACMSFNFKIRENPMCHYITALVDKHNSNYGDAIKALSTALTLMNITVKNNDVSLIDKASIYVELIDTLNIVGQTDEALKILEEATHDLQGTPEESRILLLSADNLIVRKNTQGAIELLSKIGKDESCYREARMKMADIFLKNQRDKHAFLEVYQEFVDAKPSAESYVLLGDACMKILEPDEALANYEKALRENPNDLFLTAKMGQALVETHYFNRAVEYYKKAIKEMKDPELKLQLGDLYLNLREYEKGELLLLDELEDEHRKSNAEDISDLLYRAKLYSLLAEIQEKSGNFTFAVKSLKDAMDCQMRVRKRMALEQNGKALQGVLRRTGRTRN